MLWYNLKLVYRRLIKDRQFTILNLLGLSTGLAAAILIYFWVHDEYSINTGFKKSDRLYQVMSNFKSAQGIYTVDKSPVPLSEAILKDMPEVENIVPVNDFFTSEGSIGVLSFENKKFQSKGWFAGKDFFNVFSYELLQGNKDEALKDESSIAISENIARKIFGTAANAYEKTIEWKNRGFQGIFKVSGVFKTPPESTTAEFDLLINIGMLLKNDRWAGNWTNDYANTYLTLKNGASEAAFNKKISHYLITKEPGLKDQTLFIQKFSDRYLYGNYSNGVPVGGRIAYVKLFSMVALFILVLACVNFMNLSTAQASGRIKEVGVKKSIGAARSSLVIQFLAESMLMSLLSLFIAVAMIVLILPEFNAITGKHIQIDQNIGAIIPMLIITLITGFISGCYPAFYLSGFNPVAVLKGKLKGSIAELFIRKGLVILQFSITVVFIARFLIIHEQIKYTQNKNLGYNKDNVLCFTWKGELYDEWSGLGTNGKSNAKFESFMQRLSTVPGVLLSTNTGGNILDNIPGQSGISWSGKESEKSFSFQSPLVGYDFLKTLDIPIKEGRSFSKDYHDDYSKIILNEAAVDMMKLKDPVGKKIDMNGGSEIIGVVKNFHYGSLHNSIEPLILRCYPMGPNVLVKLKAGAEQTTIAGLQKLYADYLPGYSFDYNFMDEAYQAQYTSELRVAALSRYFAILAMLISCLGLFGLAAYTAQKRQKEIGIRKILGAKVLDLSVMLSGDFIKLVMYSVLIAIPVAWLAIHKWLESFSEKVSLNWWYFTIPAVAALLVAMITVSFQVFKAAIANPVKSLRTE